MKKTLKVLGLLVVAAALFAGCKNNADEGSGEKNIQEALFDKADATKDAEKVNYTDGNWTMRCITTVENPFITKWVEAKELNFEIDGKKAGGTDLTYIESGIVVAKEDFDEENIAKAKENGFTNISGKEATYYRECDAKKYLELSEKFDDKDESDIAEEDKIDYMVYSNVGYGLMSAMMLRDGNYFDDFKSNEDGTKYYGKKSEKKSGMTQEYYIMKKQFLNYLFNQEVITVAGNPGHRFFYTLFCPLRNLLF